MITGEQLTRGMTVYFCDRTVDGIVKGTVGECNPQAPDEYAVPILCKELVTPDGVFKTHYYMHRRVLPQELYATAKEANDMSNAEFVYQTGEYAKAIKNVEDLCMFALEHDLLGDYAARYIFKIKCELFGIRLDLNRID